MFFFGIVLAFSTALVNCQLTESKYNNWKIRRMQREGVFGGSKSLHVIGEESKRRIKEIYGGKRSFTISNKLANLRNRDFVGENKFLADKVQFDETIKKKRIAPAFQMMRQRNALKGGLKSKTIKKPTSMKKKKHQATRFKYVLWNFRFRPRRK